MPSVTTQIVLFASSFAPLFGLFALLNTFGRGVASIICLIVAIVSAAGLLGYMLLLLGQDHVGATISAASPRDQDMIGYVVTYLLPFITLGAGTWRERAAILIFIALVAILYIRASLFYVNPLLALVRYRLFEADVGTGRSVIIISRRRSLPPGLALPLKTITDLVYLEATRGSGSRAQRGISSYVPPAPGSPAGRK